MGPRLRRVALSYAVACSLLAGTMVGACGSSGSGSGASSTASGGASAPSAPSTSPTSPSAPSAGDGASGGTATPSASSGSGATSGGTTTGGSSGSSGTSANGSAGPSEVDPCQGLVPTADAGRAVRFDTGTHRVCARATSDPTGQLAFGIAGGSSPTDMAFQLYGPDGVQRGALAVYQTSNADIDPWFHWTSAGYAGLVHEPPPALALRSFDHSGGILATTSDYVASSAPDAQGGTVILARSYDASVSPPFGPTKLVWLGPAGEIGRTAVLDQDPFMLIVSWVSDHVLTLLPSLTGLRARWYDATGAPLTPWFDTGALPANGQASLHLLTDGTVALSDGQRWFATFRDGVDGIDPPPAWLAARPGTRLATIRQGRGYAVLPFPSNSTNQPDLASVEIVTTSGQSCGTVKLPAHVTDPGVTATPTALDVGQDGTLIQTENLDGTDLGFGIHCGFRWWTELLK